MEEKRAPEFVWTDGIEAALNNIRQKSLATSDEHASKYSVLKGYLKYFRVPVIVLAGLNSVFSVGLQPYLSQNIISVLSCSISLTCGVIGSVELFVGIQTMMEQELFSSKDFYILACDIYKTLSVERQYRMLDGITYLDNINMKYCHLIEQCNLVDSGRFDLLQMVTSAKSAKSSSNHLQIELPSQLDIPSKLERLRRIPGQIQSRLQSSRKLEIPGRLQLEVPNQLELEIHTQPRKEEAHPKKEEAPIKEAPIKETPTENVVMDVEEDFGMAVV